MNNISAVVEEWLHYGVILVLFILIFRLGVKIFGYFVCYAYTLLKNDLKNFEKKDSLEKKSSSFVWGGGRKNRIKKWVYGYINGYYRYKLIQVGRIPSHRIRNWIYRNVFGVNLSRNVIIYYGAEIRSPRKLSIGRGSIIGDKSVLDARCEIRIGSNVNFSSEVHIWTLQHDYNSHNFTTAGQGRGVTIGDRVWIGPRVTILPGVVIGEGAVVGAGSVVTKDIAPYTLNGGIPCRKIAERTRELSYEFEGKHLRFL